MDTEEVVAIAVVGGGPAGMQDGHRSCQPLRFGYEARIEEMYEKLRESSKDTQRKLSDDDER